MACGAYTVRRQLADSGRTLSRNRHTNRLARLFHRVYVARGNGSWKYEQRQTLIGLRRLEGRTDFSALNIELHIAGDQGWLGNRETRSLRLKRNGTILHRS